MTGSHTTFPPDPRSPARARAEVRAFCADRPMGHLVDDATLIVSELVTNACRVSVVAVTLSLIEEDGALLVAVGDDCRDPLPVGDDDSPGAAARYSAPGWRSESGRGLRVLDELASAWGTTATPGGKDVWFRLP